jgi:hypothetical protein
VIDVQEALISIGVIATGAVVLLVVGLWLIDRFIFRKQKAK